MRLRHALSLLTLSALFPLRLSAQNLNLRDLLTDFIRNGITLAPPAAGPSHVAHFIGDASLQPLEQLNRQLAIQLSSFPLASSAGGFTYQYDPALATFVRASESFGPIYTERADTIGKGKFNSGLNFSHFTYDRIDDLDLRDGDVQIVFTHQDVNNDGSNLQPYVEGDVIPTRSSFKIDTSITAFTLSYGVSDRLDIGVAVPIVQVDLEAQANPTILRLATGTSSPIHRFLNGTTEDQFRQSGTASGIGDVVLRGKFQFLRKSAGGLAIAADVRLPTGEERDLLGTGTTRVKGFLIGSAHLGTFSPHVNGGYTWSKRSSGIPDEIDYAAGFDWALHPRLTLVVDALGRTQRRSQVLRVRNVDFQFNTNPDPSTPPVVEHRQLPQLVAETQDVTSFFGSVGFKVNPIGNLLVTINGLFSLNRRGLQDKFAPLVGLDYSF